MRVRTREMAAAMRGREKVWCRMTVGLMIEVARGWEDDGELEVDGEVRFECDGGGGGGGGGRGSTKVGVRGMPSEEK